MFFTQQKHLPDDKPRLMTSVWRPDAVVQAVDMGIDLFDSSYPYIVTERGAALVFRHSLKSDPEDKDEAVKVTNGYTISLKDKR